MAKNIVQFLNLGEKKTLPEAKGLNYQVYQETIRKYYLNCLSKGDFKLENNALNKNMSFDRTLSARESRIG